MVHFIGHCVSFFSLKWASVKKINVVHVDLVDKFLPFKTPLDARYVDQIPEECRFDLDMLFSSMKSFKVK